MRTLVIVPLVALLSCLAGCASFKIAPPEINEYRLEYPPPTIEKTPLPIVLRMAPFGAAAVYDRESIVFRDDPYTTGTYFYDRWIAHPASMIADLLARDLTASGLYQAVQQGASALPSDYHLSGEVEEIEERMAEEDCSARLTLRVLLARARTLRKSRVAFQKRYTTAEPCTGNGARGFVDAMSKALETISGRLQHDLYDVIAADRVPQSSPPE